MADSQDKLTPSDAATLAELQKQRTKEKSVSTGAPAKKQPAVTATNKSADKSSTQSGDTSVKKTSVNNGDSGNNAKSSASSSSRKAVNQPTGKTAALWFFTLMNLLMLVAIIGAAYWAWLQWQVQDQQQNSVLAAQNASIKQQQTSMDQQQANMLEQQNAIAESIASNQLAKGELEQQNLALQTSLSSLIEQFQLTDTQVQTNQNNLDDISGRRPADWLLAEADYLVRMAGRKLWLEHDVKTAIMMLQSADSRIQDLDDPSLLPLRAKLAEDLQALQQVNQVSTNSIALALGAMLKQVDNLPLAFFKRPKSEAIDETVTGSIDDWRTNLARNWQKATRNFFSYKKVTTDIKPFMSEQQQWLSKEQLKLALMQAKMAVLKENSTLYQQTLQTAFSLLIESFDIEKDRVIQFTDSLSNLQQTDFERTYPEQFNVAPLLQDIIEERLNNRFVNGNN